MALKKFPAPYKFTKLSLKIRGPIPVIQLVSRAKSVEELKVLLKGVSGRDRRRIKEKTKNQSECPNWHLYRQAIITGTLVKRICSFVQKPKNSSTSLNKAISKFGQGKFTNEALQWGITNEEKGIKVLWDYFKKNHKEPKLHKIGLCLDKELAFLGGSPDCVLTCENCCCEGKKVYIGEVKCPFRLRYSGISAWTTLEYLTENCELKKNHTYYYQQNLYAGINEASLTYFVIWTPYGHLIIPIQFDPELYALIRKSAEKYYFEHYVKEFF